MAKIDITKTGLVWLGKYNEDGSVLELSRVSAFPGYRARERKPCHP